MEMTAPDDPNVCLIDVHLPWKLRYIKRMADRGIDPRDAALCCDAGASDHDYTSSPEDAADDEMSYWTDDGELA